MSATAGPIWEVFIPEAHGLRRVLRRTPRLARMEYHRHDGQVRIQSKEVDIDPWMHLAWALDFYRNAGTSPLTATMRFPSDAGKTGQQIGVIA